MREVQGTTGSHCEQLWNSYPPVMRARSQQCFLLFTPIGAGPQPLLIRQKSGQPVLQQGHSGSGHNHQIAGATLTVLDQTLFLTAVSRDWLAIAAGQLQLAGVDWLALLVQNPVAVHQF